MVNSPLIWAGGKSRAMPHVLEALPKGECLVEPFVGSGSVFLNTDYKTYIPCDSNAALMNFYSILKSNTKSLLDVAATLFDGGNNEDAYYKRRNEFNDFNRGFPQHNKKTSDGKVYYQSELVKFAALFLYLNRHCYNGLYRVNGKNEFNVPFGRRRKPIFPVAEIQHFAKRAYEKGAQFLCADFRYTIPVASRIFERTVIYCDPPYLPASKTADFTAYGKPFTVDDHRDLVESLITAHNNEGCLSVFSGSDTPETRKIYYPFTLNSFEIRRSVGAKSRNLAGEVIGSLRVCGCCGCTGGGCPDCGAVMGDATYSEMVASGAFDDQEVF